MRAADLRGLELITQDPQNKLPLFGSARLLLVGMPPLTRLGQDLIERLRQRSPASQDQEAASSRSQTMARVLELAAKAAPTATTVLMNSETGETGTGK